MFLVYSPILLIFAALVIPVDLVKFGTRAGASIYEWATEDSEKTTQLLFD